MGLCDSLLPALAFRALAGMAMAGMYMPGLRALTHGVEGATRARIAAWYTSSFTIGASLSFLFGHVGTLLGWRSAFVLAGILGAAGVLIAWTALPRGATGRKEEPQPRLDFRPVLANRDVLTLIVGYAGAIWGCVGLRQWIVVFLTFCAGEQAADGPQPDHRHPLAGALPENESDALGPSTLMPVVPPLMFVVAPEISAATAAPTESPLTRMPVPAPLMETPLMSTVVAAPAPKLISSLST